MRICVTKLYSLFQHLSYMRFESILFIPVLVLASCVHEPYAYDGPPVDPNPNDTTTNPPQGKPCNPDSVYFQNQILPLILANCATAGCHAAPGQDGVILDNYANIISTGKIKPGNPGGSDLYEVLVDTDPDKRMPPPPASPLPPEQIALIQKWIQQGAPDNYCDGCDTSDVKFSTHVLPLMAQYCQSCHGNSVQNGGVKLTTHAEVVSAVTTRNLLENIKHLQGFKAMPPGTKLPNCEIRKVEIWVDDGMPNN